MSKEKPKHERHKTDSKEPEEADSATALKLLFGMWGGLVAFLILFVLLDKC
jgi:hypothetical protein